MSTIFAVLVFPFVFFGIAFYSLVFFIPRFERFLGMMSLKQGWRSIFSFQEQMSFTLKILFVICIVTVPLLFLSLNNYSYVTQNGACLNNFFAFREQCYSWKEVTKVSIVNHVRTWSKDEDLELGYVLHFHDGEEMDLWNMRDPIDKIVQIDQTLVSYDIPFEIEPMDDVVLQKIYERFFDEDLRVVKKILRI